MQEAERERERERESRPNCPVPQVLLMVVLHLYRTSTCLKGGQPSACKLGKCPLVLSGSVWSLHFMGRHDQERQAGPLVPSKGDEPATAIYRGLEMP